jgi:hypothetical protein
MRRPYVGEWCGWAYRAREPFNRNSGPLQQRLTHHSQYGKRLAQTSDLTGEHGAK